MKKFFQKLIVALSLAVAVSGCFWPIVKPTGQTQTVLGSPVMKTSYTMEATLRQVDSICVADTLPSLDMWNGTSFSDFETGEVIIKRLYIKHSGELEIMYTVTGKSEPYTVTMRITK